MQRGQCDRALRLTFALLMAFACTVPAALAAHSRWTHIKGALDGYVSGSLPAGFVIYVFTPSGTLEAVSATNLTDGYAPMKKLETAIRTTNFRAWAPKQPANIKKSLKIYLSDQGYSLKRLVSQSTQYSLLLVMNTFADKTCRKERQFQRHYEKAIHHVVTEPAVQSDYTVTVLTLVNTKMPVRCGG